MEATATLEKLPNALRGTARHIKLHNDVVEQLSTAFVLGLSQAK
jgi:hypothetical protein